MKLEEIIPGRFYKYKGLWGHVIMLNSVLTIFSNGDAKKVNEEWGKENYSLKITEEMAAEFEVWPEPTIEINNTEISQRQKEIALNAALTVYTQHNATAKDIVDSAQIIFEWLTR